MECCCLKCYKEYRYQDAQSQQAEHDKLKSFVWDVLIYP